MNIDLTQSETYLLLKIAEDAQQKQGFAGVDGLDIHNIVKKLKAAHQSCFRQEIVRALPNGPLRISGPCPPDLADGIEAILRATVPLRNNDEGDES
jgi:hypothetical protein